MAGCCGCGRPEHGAKGSALRARAPGGGVLRRLRRGPAALCSGAPGHALAAEAAGVRSGCP
eukprot:10916121-Lingulodinium_polyedra.AAC.1